MGWGEVKDLGSGTTGQISEAHRLLDEYGVTPGPLVVRTTAMLKDFFARMQKVTFISSTNSTEDKTNEISDELKQHLKEAIQKDWDNALAEVPWWCPMCGAGGNYDGGRPDEYWIPPEDHQCPPKKPNLKGITGI